MRFDVTTLLLQALNFIVLVLVLRRFLYRPVADVIARRKAEVDAVIAEADAKKQDASRIAAEATAKLDTLELERGALLERAGAEGREERERLLADARAEAETMLRAARQTIAGERAAALSTLSSRAAGLAADLAAEMLQKAGITEIDALLLDNVLARLDEIPAADLRELAASSAGKRARVVTSRPLDEATKKRARERIAARLGKLDVEFAVDAALLGGAELHLPSSRITQSLRDLLAEARKTMESPLADAR